MRSSDRTRTRTAASSIASGIPPSASQIRPADGGALRAQREVRPHLRRPFGEQAHRVGLDQPRGDRAVVGASQPGGRERQRRHAPGGLTSDSEWLTTGRHDREVRATPQQLRDEMPARTQNVLAVVEHDECPLRREVSDRRPRAVFGPGGDARRLPLPAQSRRASAPRPVQARATTPRRGSERARLRPRWAARRVLPHPPDPVNISRRVVARRVPSSSSSRLSSYEARQVGREIVRHPYPRDPDGRSYTHRWFGGFLAHDPGAASSSGQPVTGGLSVHRRTGLSHTGDRGSGTVLPRQRMSTSQPEPTKAPTRAGVERTARRLHRRHFHKSSGPNGTTLKPHRDPITDNKSA